MTGDVQRRLKGKSFLYVFILVHFHSGNYLKTVAEDTADHPLLSHALVTDIKAFLHFLYALELPAVFRGVDYCARVTCTFFLLRLEAF